MMGQYQTTKLVNVDADVAYSVAADVASYKDFLPLLQSSTVRGPKRKDGTTETFKAELVVGYEKLGIRESFISNVEADRENRSVTATSAEGPMKALTTSWKIDEATNGSTVTVTINYAFKSRMMQVVFGGLLDVVAPKIMKAFEDRARRVATTASTS